ncbi:MAG: hypothetical protein WAV85_04010 [Rhodoferax sp.]
MKKYTSRKWVCGAMLASALGVAVSQAAETTATIIGKNDWLFVKYEFALPSDLPDTQATVQLIEKTSKLLSANGIALALVIVPSKVRIYAEHLPDSAKLDSYTADKYESVAKTLIDSGVNVVNLNQAFLNSPLRNSDTPFFLRLDTHWAPAGALLAAQTVKAEIDRNPTLNAALAATPETKYTFSWNSRKINHRARDLVNLLPKEAQNFAYEQILLFKSEKVQAAQAGLLNAGDNVGITVIGSSYTNKNTGYPDGLRFTLQRDLLDISIPVDQGPWVGLESYFRDDAFQTNKPKLIIWEIPERELRSPPNYKYRDTRYISDNNEWFTRVSALVKKAQ